MTGRIGRAGDDERETMMDDEAKMWAENARLREKQARGKIERWALQRALKWSLRERWERDYEKQCYARGAAEELKNLADWISNLDATGDDDA